MNVLPVQVAATGPIAESLHSVKEQYARNAEHPLARQEDLERTARNAQSRLFGAQINVVPFDAVLPLAVPSKDESGAPVPTAHIHNISAGPVADATFTLRGMPGRGNSISCEIDMNPALYTAKELERHAARLSEWLPAYAAEAQREGASLNDLGLATEAELATLRELTAPTLTEHPMEYKTLLGRFCDAVAAHPQALAVLDSAPAGLGCSPFRCGGSACAPRCGAVRGAVRPAVRWCHLCSGASGSTCRACGCDDGGRRMFPAVARPRSASAERAGAEPAGTAASCEPAPARAV